MTSQPPVQRRSWQVMGTVASLIAGCDPATADSARDAAAGVLSDVEARMSSYRPDSEVGRFAAGQLPAGPSADLRSVLAACSWLEEVSAGVFSPYPGGPGTELDVAGYVKGWAVDRAAEALDSIGLEHWALSVGGDWRCRGGHPSGDPWRIAILDPTDSAQVRAVVLVTDGAVATSGRYERGDHVHLPPGAIGSSTRVGSFTVTGPQLAFADAFATVGLLMGVDGLTWVAGFEGYAAALIHADGTMDADAAMTLQGGRNWPDPLVADPARAREY